MSSNDFFASVGRDVRHALRGLKRRPTFTVAAVLTLALGIGATTAIFSVVNGVLIEPLPYPEAEAVVTVGHSAVTGGERRVSNFAYVSPQVLEVYATNGQAFEEFGIYRSAEATITGLGNPEQANTLVVTAGTLRALNVQPALGRWFSRADDQPGAAETAILSDDYWQRRFGGDPSVIGRTITVDGRPHEVIGDPRCHVGSLHDCAADGAPWRG